MLLDIETCTPLLRSNIAAEKDGAAEGLRIVHTQVHVWQQKVEAILMAAYSFLPSLLTRADGTERGVLYNDYRILIEQVIELATRELNLGVVAYGGHSQALHHVHAQRDLHDLLTHHSVGAGALVNPAGRLPPPPPGFATPTGHSLQPNGTFEQYQLPLIVHSTCFVGTGDFCGGFVEVMTHRMFVGREQKAGAPVVVVVLPLPLPSRIARRKEVRPPSMHSSNASSTKTMRVLGRRIPDLLSSLSGAVIKQPSSSWNDAVPCVHGRAALVRKR
jgi:hypothetical protein